MTLIVTQVGLNRAIQADTAGISMKITHVAIGTEGYIPTKSITTLKNETVRVPVDDNGNQVSPNQIQLTATFDGDKEIVGREVGFFLEDGTLFAIDSHPSDIITYKSGAKGSVSIEVFDLILDSIPPNSISTFISGELHLHDTHKNPHPQYHLPVPVVDLPFDSNLVNKLFGALKFSRASATNNVNSSGTIEALGIDEPAITRNGLSIYQGIVNYMASNDFSKVRIKGYEKISLGDGFTRFTETKIKSARVLIINNFRVEASEKISFTFCIKPDDNRMGIELSIFAGTKNSRLKVDLNTLTGIHSGQIELDNFKITSIENGVFRVSYTVVAILSSRVFCQVYFQDTEVNDSPKRSGDGKSGVSIGHGVLSNLKGPLPFLSINKTESTRAPDIVSFSTMSNMPVPGSPFTILVDVHDLPSNGNHVVFSIGNKMLLRRLGDENRIQFKTGNMSLLSNHSYDAKGKHRFAIVFDGEDCMLFDHGKLLDSKPTIMKYSLADDFMIGVIEGGEEFLNTELSNFKIYHKALSVEQLIVLEEA